MTMARFVLAAAALLATATIAAAGESYRIDRNGSEVSFEVRHITGPVITLRTVRDGGQGHQVRGRGLRLTAQG